jgi:type II restriction/modification system DNA methylase subunit YeeA
VLFKYFSKHLNNKNEIDKTDKEIDQMVYQLYGLTDEEIKIVEGK